MKEIKTKENLILLKPRLEEYNFNFNLKQVIRNIMNGLVKAERHIQVKKIYKSTLTTNILIFLKIIPLNTFIGDRV